MSAQANPFNTRLVFGLVVAGIVAFAALIMLVAYGSRIGPIGNGRGPVLSTSATGFKGLVTLVDRFREVQTISGPRDLATDNLVVAAINPENDADDVHRFLELRRGRATLLILPKWVTMPDREHRGWVRALGPGAGQAGGRTLGRDIQIRTSPNAVSADRFASGEDFLDGVRVPVPGNAQTITGDEVTPLLTLPNGDALIGRLGDQPHYVAADPDLFNNQSLDDPARARAALALVDAFNTAEGGGVAFDLTVNGLADNDSPSLLRTALEPPFLAMTLALFVAALLAGLHGAFRFGAARREERAIAFGKAALVENSAGLIRLARREANLGGAYADVVRQDSARLAGAPPALQGEALDAYLDRLSREGQPRFSELAWRLAAARDRHELVAAARALFSWKKDLIR